MGKSGKHGRFSTRRRDLEDRFFREQDQILLQALREKRESKRRREELSEASGITDEQLLNQLDEMDIQCETLAALSLIPMLAVAWADGAVDPKERRAVIAAAEEEGIEPEHPAHQLLENWLNEKPEVALWNLWKDYVAALAESSTPELMAAIKEQVLARATAAAKAAGGILGFGNKISKPEQAVLDELSEALGP
jgi:hypothetical protein